MKLILLFVLLLCLNLNVAAQQIISLTWNDVIGIGLKENLEIKIRAHEYEFQSQNEWKALGEFLPTIDYQFQAINNLELPEFVVPNFGRVRFGTQYNYAHLLQAQWPIFTGLARIANWKIQKKLTKSMQQELHNKEDEVVLKALEAYFNLLLADNVVLVNDRAYRASTANFEQVEKFYNMGASSKLDFLRASSNLSSTLAPLISAKNGRILAEKNLKFILNINQKDSLIVLDSLKQIDFVSDYNDMTMDELYTLAEANRPDLKTMHLQNEIASDQKLLSVSSFLPSLVLAANVQHQAQVESAQFVPNDFVRSKAVALSLQFPLFQGTKRIFDYQQSVINKRKSEIMVDLSHKAAYLEIDASVLKILETRENLSTLRTAMDEAREALRLANLNYQEGIITQVDVLTSQLALTSSELSYLRGIFEFNVSQLYLLKSIGKMNSVWETE
jgi:outer membrane protein TolC